MKLYHHPLPGHSRRARVDLKAGAHKTPEFLALNPVGQAPVLNDDGVIVSDSNPRRTPHPAAPKPAGPS